MGEVFGAGVSSVVPAGIERGSVFPSDPAVGDYFYREDLDILFARVKDTRFGAEVTVWSAIESFSSETLNIYAAPDGYSFRESDCDPSLGYSADHPTNCMLEVEHMIPKTLRGDVRVYVDGYVGSLGSQTTHAEMKIRATYRGNDSAGSISFREWTSRVERVPTVVGTQYTSDGQSTVYGNYSSFSFYETILGYSKQTYQVWDSSGNTYMGVKATAEDELVVSGNASWLFVDNAEFSIATGTDSIWNKGVNATIWAEGNFGLYCQIPFSGSVRGYNLIELYIYEGCLSVESINCRQTSLGGCYSQIYLTDSPLASFEGAATFMTLDNCSISAMGDIFTDQSNPFILKRSDVVVSGPWYVVSTNPAAANGVQINRWSSFEFQPNGGGDVIANHILGFVAAYSVDQTVSNGLIIGV